MRAARPAAAGAWPRVGTAAPEQRACAAGCSDVLSNPHCPLCLAELARSPWSSSASHWGRTRMRLRLGCRTALRVPRLHSTARRHVHRALSSRLVGRRAQCPRPGPLPRPRQVEPLVLGSAALITGFTAQQLVRPGCRRVGRAGSADVGVTRGSPTGTRSRLIGCPVPGVRPPVQPASRACRGQRLNRSPLLTSGHGRHVPPR